MRQFSETYHRLEMRIKRGDEWTVWTGVIHSMYRPAELLAYYGRLSEAIEDAQRVTIKERGSMAGYEFRCVTTTKTVTMPYMPTDRESMEVG